jgi:hypothetical protein
MLSIKNMRKLNISKTTIDLIIELSGKIRNWGRPVPGTPFVICAADVRDLWADPTEDDLAYRGLIQNLPEEQRDELQAMMMVGRGFVRWKPASVLLSSSALLLSRLRIAYNHIKKGLGSGKVEHQADDAEDTPKKEIRIPTKNR